MINYSKEFCDLFLQEDWMKGFSLNQNSKLSSLDDATLSTQAITGLLLKYKKDKKPISLTDTAYLALSKAEKKRKIYFSKAKQTSDRFSQKGLPPDTEEMFDTWLFHDGSLIQLLKTGNSVEMIISVDGASADAHPYCKLVFKDCICLLNEIESPVTVTKNAEGIFESDYYWVFHEVCRVEEKACQLHIAIDRWCRMKAIALEFDKCIIQPCNVILNKKGVLVAEE